MINLNLEAKTNEEQKIKEYLENNVSEELAHKINNGTKFVKDNKNLINKKSLSGFLKYACTEARKLVEKSAQYACVEDNTVFGWAIHYFEEDSIEEKLYTEDGSEYKTSKPAQTKSQETKSAKPSKQIKETDKQTTLFDFLTTNEDELIEKNEESIKPKIENVETEIDYETGEIIPKKLEQQTFDMELLKLISTSLDGNTEAK